MGRNAYAELGINPNASKREIKRAFLELAKKYHPDASKEAGAEDRFKAISAAYQTLSDPTSKQLLDAKMQAGSSVYGRQPVSPDAAKFRDDFREAMRREVRRAMMQQTQGASSSNAGEARLHAAIQSARRARRAQFWWGLALAGFTATVLVSGLRRAAAQRAERKAEHREAARHAELVMRQEARIRASEAAARIRRSRDRDTADDIGRHSGRGRGRHKEHEPRMEPTQWNYRASGTALGGSGNMVESSSSEGQRGSGGAPADLGIRVLDIAPAPAKPAEPQSSRSEGAGAGHSAPQRAGDSALRTAGARHSPGGAVAPNQPQSQPQPWVVLWPWGAHHSDGSLRKDDPAGGGHDGGPSAGVPTEEESCSDDEAVCAGTETTPEAQAPELSRGGRQ